MKTLKGKLSLTMLVAMVLSACGGGGGGAAVSPPPVVPPPSGGPPPPPLPPADLSGTWFLQSSGTVQTCGRGIWLDGWATEVTQTDDQISFLNSDGSTLSGTVDTMTITISGSIPEPANDALGLPQGSIGDATFDMAQLTIGAAENTLFGTVDWTWTYITPTSQVTCDGSSQFFARRDGQEQEVEPNNDNTAAQAINIITNDNGLPQNSTAGWVTGSVDLVTDEFDVFQFTINARSALEVELSHFEPATEDLDVYVLDSNLNGLAISDTGDSYEIFAVDLDPGTYFIVVEAFLTAAAANYVLSVDLNEI